MVWERAILADRSGGNEQELHRNFGKQSPSAIYFGTRRPARGKGGRFLIPSFAISKVLFANRSGNRSGEMELLGLVMFSRAKTHYVLASWIYQLSVLLSISYCYSWVVFIQKAMIHITNLIPIKKSLVHEPQFRLCQKPFLMSFVFPKAPSKLMVDKITLTPCPIFRRLFGILRGRPSYL